MKPIHPLAKDWALLGARTDIPVIVWDFGWTSQSECRAPRSPETVLALLSPAGREESRRRSATSGRDDLDAWLLELTTTLSLKSVQQCLVRQGMPIAWDASVERPPARKRVQGGVGSRYADPVEQLALACRWHGPPSRQLGRCVLAEATKDTERHDEY
jgi:hypothetical protein